jgi:hypothetical protein
MRPDDAFLLARQVTINHPMVFAKTAHFRELGRFSAQALPMRLAKKHPAYRFDRDSSYPNSLSELELPPAAATILRLLLTIARKSGRRPGKGEPLIFAACQCHAMIRLSWPATGCGVKVVADAVREWRNGRRNGLSAAGGPAEAGKSVNTRLN